MNSSAAPNVLTPVNQRGTYSDDYREVKINTIPFARVNTVQEGGEISTWIEWLETRSPLERLVQHIKASLTVPGVSNECPVSVEVLFDSSLDASALRTS